MEKDKKTPSKYLRLYLRFLKETNSFDVSRDYALEFHKNKTRRIKFVEYMERRLETTIFFVHSSFATMHEWQNFLLSKNNFVMNLENACVELLKSLSLKHDFDALKVFREEIIPKTYNGDIVLWILSGKNPYYRLDKVVRRISIYSKNKGWMTCSVTYGLDTIEQLLKMSK